MFKKISMLGAALVMGATTLVPAMPAAAQSYSSGYGDRYYQGDRYQGRYYQNNRYDRQRSYRGNDRRYVRNNYRGCDNGTGGTVIGAIAGGLLGNEVVGRRGDQTLGAILGAGVGALAGRAIDRADDPCRGRR